MGASSMRWMWWATENRFPYPNTTSGINCTLGKNAPLPGAHGLQLRLLPCQLAFPVLLAAKQRAVNNMDIS
jgi:hypothetical protein